MASRWKVLAVAAALLLAGGVPGQAAPPVPTPTLTAPPAGIHGHAMWDSWYDLKPFGYTETEYLVSGTASAADGTKAPYTTRILVTRPASVSRFNGSVVLDWVNVTAQFENAVDTMEARQMLMREGFAYVHVSAQKAGLCCSPLTPQVWDPVRYASISHPGDQYANDILSQVAKAVRTKLGMPVRTVLAVGQSQSASKLFDYVKTTQDTARVIDGFLIHGGGGKTYPKPLTTPVLHLLSDNEANPTPPTKDPRYRLWEVAGTAHSDFWIGYQSVFGLSGRLVDQPAQDKAGYDATLEAAGNYGQQLHPMLATCVLAGSTVPMHYATSAALHQLNVWARTGQAPRVTPRFAFDSAGEQAKDAHENSLGGIRMPPLEVPVATYRSTTCPLGGITQPFPDSQLTALYGTFATYQAKMKAATDTAVRRGWLLPEDARDQMRRVCTAAVRFGGGTCAPYAPPAFATTG
jgi:hypothetical protein